MKMIKNLLAETEKPLIMGIINCTPDSFYHASRKVNLKSALDTAFKMIEEGADIIDIGGESTRPGSEYIETEEEIRRILPFLKEFRKNTDFPVSVDTRKSETASAALENGADIINDISALSDDPVLADIIVIYNADIILMHKKGLPSDMQNNPSYRSDAVKEIKDYLEKRAEYALGQGIEKDRIILDPGLGFGKRLQDNLAIIKNIESFKESGYPVLIGHSRKSFIGILTGREPEDRLEGSLAAGLLSAVNGADILRVHDVKETSDTLKILKAVNHL